MGDRSRAALAVFLVFLVALLVRGIGIGDRSFWLDEASTLDAALAPDLPALFTRVERAEIGRGPLYYLILRGWVHVFGAGEASVRWPSAIFGAAAAAAACLWAAFLWAGFFRGRRGRLALGAGLLAGAFVALHPLLIGLSREARSYPLSHAFVFWAGALSIPAYSGRGARLPARLGVAVLAALGVSCHLFTGFFAFGLYLSVAVARWPDRPTLRRLLADVGIFTALLCIQLPLTIRQATYALGLMDPPAALTFRDVAHYLRTLGGEPTVWILVAAVPVSLVLHRREPAIRYSLALLLAPLTAVLLVHFLGRPILLQGARYIAWGAAPVALLLAGVARDRRARWLVPLIAASLAVGVVRGREDERKYSEDWRAVAAALDSEVRTGDRIVCVKWFVRQPLRIYYPRDLGPQQPAKLETAGVRVPDLAALHAVIEGGGRVFLVWSHAGEWDERTRSVYESALGSGVEIHRQPTIRVLRFGAGS